MNRLFLLALGSPLVLLGSVSEVLAGVNDSAYSVSNWTAEGNGRCSDYFENSVVLEASTNDILGGVATGPDTPEDVNTDDEVITFTVNVKDATRIDFDSTTTTSTRVDAVILKNSRDIAVFIEPAGGVINDVSLGFPDGTAIASIAFCYGLPSEPVVVIDEPLPICSVEGDADGCESEEDFECDMTVNKDASGNETGGVSVSCCSCGTGVTTVCDPAVSGDCGFTMNAFTHILFGQNGRWICFQTDSGQRCYYSR